MHLYHFTGLEMLRGIGQHGLTVGDVPTDIGKLTGRIGVWLTSSNLSDGHGLDGSTVNKRRVRLTVELDETDTKLARWSAWSAVNVTPETIQILQTTDGSSAETWYVYFGWIKPEQITEVVDMASGETLDDWATRIPEEKSRSGVPYWRRDAWQKKMLKDFRKFSARR